MTSNYTLAVDAMWNQLVGNGMVADPMTAIVTSYTNVLGGFFYFLLFGLAITMIYMKTRNFANTAIVILLMAGGLTLVVPQTLGFAIVMMAALGAAFILYKMFK
jgi:hypothetical protein